MVIRSIEKGSHKNKRRIFIRVHEIRVESVILVTFVGVVGEEIAMDAAGRTCRHDESRNK
jgi:hypothetical protein